MEYIDLSYKLENGMPVYPGDAEVSLVHAKTLDKDRHNAYRISTGLHAGTHIDFPMHLLPDDRTADTYPLDRFAGRGCLIDARGVKQIEYKAEYGHRVQKGDIVLLYTGACASFGQPGYYTDHPAVADDLAEFLVSREIKMFGADLPAPDYPPFPVHKLLLRNGIFIIENMVNLDRLLGVESFEVFAPPLRICAEASLTRAFARCP